MSSSHNDDLRQLSILIADAIIDDDLLRGAETHATVEEPGRVLATVDGREYVIAITPTVGGTGTPITDGQQFTPR